MTEVLISSPEIERRIAANETPERIAEGARDAGMRGLWESGVQHVHRGITSVEELLRVLEAPVEQQQQAAITSGPADARAERRREAPPPRTAMRRRTTPRSTPRRFRPTFSRRPRRGACDAALEAALDVHGRVVPARGR